MRLIIGKVLVLTGVVALGCGIAYITFKRMLPQSHAASVIPSDQQRLAAATDLSEIAPKSVPASSDETEQSPFALTEPAAEETVLLAASAAEPPFLFETPESPGSVTPVSYSSLAAPPENSDSNPPAAQPTSNDLPVLPDSTAASSTGSASSAKPDSASSEAEVMFFNPANTGSEDDPSMVVVPQPVPDAAPAPDTSAHRTGGLTLLPSGAPARPGFAQKKANPKSTDTRTNPGTATRPASSVSATTSRSLTTPRPSPAGDATAASPDPQTQPEITTRTPSRPRTQPAVARTPAVPAGNLFFSANQTPRPANPAKDPLLASTSRSVATPVFPDPASVQEPPPDTAEPFFPPLDEPQPEPTSASKAERISSATSVDQPAAAVDDTPFSRTPPVEPELVNPEELNNPDALLPNIPPPTPIPGPTLNPADAQPSLEISPFLDSDPTPAPVSSPHAKPTSPPTNSLRSAPNPDPLPSETPEPFKPQSTSTPDFNPFEEPAKPQPASPPGRSPFEEPAAPPALPGSAKPQPASPPERSPFEEAAAPPTLPGSAKPQPASPPERSRFEEAAAPPTLPGPAKPQPASTPERSPFEEPAAPPALPEPAKPQRASPPERSSFEEPAAPPALPGPAKPQPASPLERSPFEEAAAPPTLPGPAKPQPASPPERSPFEEPAAPPTLPGPTKPQPAMPPDRKPFEQPTAAPTRAESAKPQTAPATPTPATAESRAPSEPPRESPFPADRTPESSAPRPAVAPRPTQSEPLPSPRNPTAPPARSRVDTPAAAAATPEPFPQDSGTTLPAIREPKTPVADTPSVPFPTDPTAPVPAQPRSILEPSSPRRSVETPERGRTVSQPGNRGEPTPEPFPIERGGSSPRSRGPLPETDEPAPFPIEAEPPREAIPADVRPLPPFEEVPPRANTETVVRPVPGRTRSAERLRPQLTIEKKAPESATIGIPHDYRITVSNDGDTPARDIVVEDELSGAAEFVSSNPPAEYDRSTGLLVWNIDELQADETREIVVRVRPTGEGMLAGTATVKFRTEVRSATLIRAPRLQLEINGPEQVRVGDDVPLQFVIRNSGSGDAAGVLLRSVLPDAIRHPEGADLEYEIELLRAGEEEVVDLTAVAAEPGRPVRISAELTAAGSASVIARNNLTVVGSQLMIERQGPARRFVGRPARFQNIVVNQTDFEAVDVIVTEDVPEGMRVLSVGMDGEYNAKTRRITWKLDRIDAGDQAVLDVELQPEATGRMESVIEVLEKAGFRSRAEENTVVDVEGLHNVTADISRQEQPVAVGERFGFTVMVDNRGTAVARNVELIIRVPAGLQVLAAGTRDVPGRLLEGNLVRYSLVQSLKPGEQLPFQVTLQGREAIRNAVIQAQLKYDEMTQPMIISESVTVFDDQE